MMDNDNRADKEHGPTDMVGELIRQAGRRENPSAEEYDRVLAAATDAFKSKVGQRRRRRFVRSLAAAVTIGLAVAIVFMNIPRPSPQPLAEIDRMIGPAEWRQGNASWSGLTGERPALSATSRIRTGPGSRLGVRMNNGVSLRLAESTEVEFTGPGEVRLWSGKVYADSGQGPGHDPGRDSLPVRRIVVETEVGRAWDIGTQFEVRYVDDIYRLRVREGRVNLRQESRELRGKAGEQLTIDTEQRVHSARIARDDVDWQWTETVAPNPVIDARPVSVLLDWVSRQTGRSVAYARPELRLAADTTILHGRIYDLEPMEALDAMLATTDFEYTLLEDGTILIDSRPEKADRDNGSDKNSL